MCRRIDRRKKGMATIRGEMGHDEGWSGLVLSMISRPEQRQGPVDAAQGQQRWRAEPLLEDGGVDPADKRNPASPVTGVDEVLDVEVLTGTISPHSSGPW